LVGQLCVQVAHLIVSVSVVIAGGLFAGRSVPFVATIGRVAGLGGLLVFLKVWKTLRNVLSVIISQGIDVAVVCLRFVLLVAILFLLLVAVAVGVI
jgi:hypothetical protein